MKSLFKKSCRVLLNPVTKQLDGVRARFNRIETELELNRMLVVEPRIRDFKNVSLQSLADAEFRVFSQWGEDGIIQYLLSKIPIANSTFVEFGVDDYRESNTRFLLMNNNWRGLLIVCDKDNLVKIRAQDYYWRHDITTICDFITKDNINFLIKQGGITGDIGLLSIDLDGNDYWVWEAINVISPRIIVVEYNSVFGGRMAVTVPYEDNFNRTRAHYSNLYFGASLPALCQLATKRGYAFVGSNSAGCNAFFVRQDLATAVMELKCEEGYVESRCRESRDDRGRLTYISGRHRTELIGDRMVFDLESHKTALIKDLRLF